MQAGTYFPKVRRMLLFGAPLILTHFLASFHAASRAPCATLSPPKADPQILERWGYAHEVPLGKSIRAKDFGIEF